MTNMFITWLEGKKPCYWPSFENKGYSFYKKVKYYNVEYEVGGGVYVPGINPNSKDVARVHCFYENSQTLKTTDRYRAIIEIFKPTKHLTKLAQNYNISFEEDIDIIQDGQAKFYNIAVQSFLGKCHIIFALPSEYPDIIVQNYVKKYKEPIYICRFKLEKIGSRYMFKCTISNENVDFHNLKMSPKKGEYIVTSLECGQDSVKLKLKKHSLVKCDSLMTNKVNPCVLIEKVNVEKLKNDIKSPVRQSSDNYDVKGCDSLKENVDKNYDDVFGSSRRKQTLVQKMYNSNIDPDIVICKDEAVNITKDLKDEIFDVDNMVNKMKKVLGIVTPKKNHERNEKRTPQRRRLPKLQEEIDDEPVKKSPRKSKSYENTNIEVDSITDKMKTKLNIVTPQKSTKSTPTRRRLSEIQNLDDSTKKLKQNESETPTQLRKSTRLRNTPRLFTIDSDSGDNISTPTKNDINQKVTNQRSARKSTRPKILDYESDDDIPTPKHLPKRNLNTPKKGTPSRIKVSSLPCEVEERERELKAGDNAFEEARAQLRDAGVCGGSLPCREQEHQDILTFLLGKLRDGAGGCIYISGVPGTGKTATVRQVIDGLQHSVQKKKFKYISVNALSLTEPKQVYVEIVRQLCNKTVHWDEALTYIRSYFMDKKHITHVLLIDELDKLCTRKQDVIYNLLDLPSTSRTALVVITIANTMDLPERLLSNKVNSRLGLTRLTFRPYKHKELVDIVKTRLSASCGVFRGEAIEYVARKVAAVSGDARRALAICARATEVAEASGSNQVTMDIVNKTLNDMVSSPKVQAIRCCSKTERLLLRSIEHEVSRTGNDEVLFSSAVSVLEGLCVLDSVAMPSVSQLLLAVLRLHFFRLVISQDGRNDVASTLLLNVSADDIHYALKDD